MARISIQISLKLLQLQHRPATAAGVARTGRGRGYGQRGAARQAGPLPWQGELWPEWWERKMDTRDFYGPYVWGDECYPRESVSHKGISNASFTRGGRPVLGNNSRANSMQSGGKSVQRMRMLSCFPRPPRDAAEDLRFIFLFRFEAQQFYNRPVQCRYWQTFCLQLFVFSITDI